MNSHLTIAVHGATGAQGSPVAQALLDRGHDVRALSRRERTQADAPGSSRAVDLADPAALRDAYRGVDAVVLQLPLVFDAAIAHAQATAVAAAVLAAGVPRVVLNTNMPLPPSPVGHPYVDARVELRDALRRERVSLQTVAPASAYFENLHLDSARLLAGVLAYPLPQELPVPWVAAADVAATIAAGVETQESGDLVVVGPDALTGDAAASALSEALEREIIWESIAPAEYRHVLRPVLGEEAADGIAGLYAAAADNPPPTPPDPETLCVGSTSLSEWARAQNWATAPQAAPA